MSIQGPPLSPTMAEDFVLPGDRTRSRSFDRSGGTRSTSSSQSAGKASGFRAGIGLQNVARRTLGIALLLFTVLMWTGSNFLASSIFADNSYSKPYFVTYVNTSFFAISFIPISLKLAYQNGFQGLKRLAIEYLQAGLGRFKQKAAQDDPMEHSTSSNTRLLDEEDEETGSGVVRGSLSMEESLEPPDAILSFHDTARLSLEFCLVWFLANYFAAACLEYTSVASSTILTSTSSFWTLAFGVLFGVESFSAKKLIGVFSLLAGIVLISSVDLSGDNDKDRGSFPHKSAREIAVGDAMAFLSAFMYGFYAILMKKRVGNEDRVSMPLFFGLVGLFNVVFLWPGFFILHFTGIEVFELPPTQWIWSIVLVNSTSSFLSDYTWAYAMLLTTPLVVTVGLSLTIPLSLVGQMVFSAQYSSPLYWVGAIVILLSFLFINHESRDDDAHLHRPIEQSVQ